MTSRPAEQVMDSIKLRLLKLRRDCSFFILLAVCSLWFLTSMYILIQAVFGEIFHWLEYGRWLGRDVYWFFGMKDGARMSDWEGVNRILTSLMSMHSTIAWALVSFLLPLLFGVLVAADERAGTTASLDKRIEELEAKREQDRAVKREHESHAPFWSFSGLAQDLGKIWSVIYVIIVGGFVVVLALTAIVVLLDY